MELIQMSHLAVGAPSQIALSCASQIEMSDLREAARFVKAGRELVGKRLVVDAAVCASRYDGALVEFHGVEWASLDARDFGADQRNAIIEVLRTSDCQVAKLLLVPLNCFSMRGVRIW